VGGEKKKQSELAPTWESIRGVNRGEARVCPGGVPLGRTIDGDSVADVCGGGAISGQPLGHEIRPCDSTQVVGIGRQGGKALGLAVYTKTVWSTKGGDPTAMGGMRTKRDIFYFPHKFRRRNDAVLCCHWRGNGKKTHTDTMAYAGQVVMVGQKGRSKTQRWPFPGN